LEFLQKYPNNDITVKIIASEDKDPNYDHEKDPYNPTPLPLKGLAGLRAETMKNILINYFNSAIEEGRLKKMPIFEEPLLLVGKGVTKKEMDDDRYVKFEFILKGQNQPSVTTTTTTLSPETCISNMIVDITYKQDGKHQCNNATYEVKLNGILLTRNDGKPYASLNNAGIFDNAGYKVQSKKIYKTINNKKVETTQNIILSNNPGGTRTNRFVVDDTILSQLRSTNISTLKLSFTCRNVSYFGLNDKSFPTEFWTDTAQGKLLNGSQLYWVNNEFTQNQWKNGCHERVGDIVITNGNGKSQNFDGASPKQKDEEIIFTEFDPCTLQVKNKTPEQQ
jgi:hypothetical protein